MADYAPVNGGDQGETLTYTAGAAITGGQVVYFSAADTVIPTAGPTLAIAGVAGHDAASGSPVTVHTGAGIIHETLTAPAALGPPTIALLATAGVGGTVLAGTYQAIVTYVNANGETTGSPVGTQVTAGSTSTLTINSPIASGTATGWYAYVTQAGGSVFTRQQAAGSPGAIAANLVLTAPPTNTGAAPPTANTTSPVTAGSLLQTAAAGAVTGGAAAGSEMGVAVRTGAAGGLLRWMSRKF